MFFNFKNARSPNGIHANQAQCQDYFTIFFQYAKDAANQHCRHHSVNIQNHGKRQVIDITDRKYV